MDSQDDISVPEILPVMTLKDTVMFPHAVMPLYIFEERYRAMLDDVLNSHRMFALFQEKKDEESLEEPPCTIGTVGIIRAAHKNPDGTSNLALQGLVRVRLLEIVEETPYRKIRVEPCPCDPEEETEELSEMRTRILEILNDEPLLCDGLPEEYVDFLKSLEQNNAFLDVAIHSLCSSSEVKQRMLETISLPSRYEAFEQYLLKEQERILLHQQLQGRTRDDEIDLN